MRKTEFTKLFSIIGLVTCLVCAVLFAEFVTAGEFREPGQQDLQVQEQVAPPVDLPSSQLVNEPVEAQELESFWDRTYPLEISLPGIAFVAALVFAVLFALIQKMFHV